MIQQIQIRADKKFTENGKKLYPNMSWRQRTRKMNELLEEILYGKSLK